MNTNESLPLSQRGDHRRILVPVDFSESSIEAVQRAAQIANKTDTIVLLHVVDFVSLVPKTGPPDWPEITRRAEIASKRFFESIEHLFTARFQTAVVQGRAHEAVVDYAARNGIDLIVLGLTPHQWFHWFRRQTARRIKESAPCAVVLVEQTNPRSRARLSPHEWFAVRGPIQEVQTQQAL